MTPDKEITRAMIFAAGLGARLRPLTLERPKALVEVGGMPLLEIAIRRLMLFGVREIIVNVHHFAEQIIRFLAAKDNFGIHIAISDERELLLDTGGGLKQAAWFFGEAPFLAVNADVLSDLDLGALLAAHRASGALATLAVRTRPSSRYLLFDDSLELCGWRHARSGEERPRRPKVDPRPYAFSGIQALSPGIFTLMPAGARVFSIIDVYLSASPEHAVKGFPHEEGCWLDVGKLPALAEAERLLPRLRLAAG
jgi:NDP-sugar pyrophosphorylase family protein